MADFILVATWLLPTELALEAPFCSTNQPGCNSSQPPFGFHSPCMFLGLLARSEALGGNLIHLGTLKVQLVYSGACCRRCCGRYSQSKRIRRHRRRENVEGIEQGGNLGIMMAETAATAIPTARGPMFVRLRAMVVPVSTGRPGAVGRQGQAAQLL